MRRRTERRSAGGWGRNGEADRCNAGLKAEERRWDGNQVTGWSSLAPAASHPDEGAGWTLASAELNGAGPTRGRAEQDTFPNYLAPTSHFLVGHYSKSTLQSAVSASASHHGRLAHTHTHAQAAEPWTHCHLRVKLTGVEEGSVQNRAETDFCFTWR